MAKNSINIAFQKDLVDGYTSPSQKARVLTEQWMKCQVYCPNCGNSKLEKYPDNSKIADFRCNDCCEKYELKSSKKKFGGKVNDGEYDTMLNRLRGASVPNLFLLNYDALELEVSNLVIVPNYYFTTSIIQARKPLSKEAERGEWKGCNILIKEIPLSGRIHFIKNKSIIPKAKVMAEWKKTTFLREQKEPSAKGWLLDIMNCIEKVGRSEFDLGDMYAFEIALKEKHKDNRHIRDKIRQQLQILRDKGYLEFVGRGNYRTV